MENPPCWGSPAERSPGSPPRPREQDSLARHLPSWWAYRRAYLAIVWKGRIGYDDTLDVLGTHGIGGILGTLATGLFASRAINPLGADGMMAGGDSSLFGSQLVAVISVVAFAFIGTYAILKLIEGSIGLRVAPEEEATGLDLTQHNERAYS